MSAEGTFVDNGRALKARLMKGEAIAPPDWIGVGVGSWVDKQNPPAESQSATGLTAEYARKKVTKKSYLQLDELNGTITWRGDKYSEVAGPTPILAYFCEFTDAEINGAQICEEALFAGEVTTNPPGLALALAAEVVSAGLCCWVRNRPLFNKTSTDSYTVICIDDNSVVA